MADGGENFSCLLDDQQKVKCAGRDYYGLLGNGAGQVDSLTFAAVSGLGDSSTISVGFIGFLKFPVSYYCPIVFTPFSLSTANKFWSIWPRLNGLGG
jgi:hypothetical protein